MAPLNLHGFRQKGAFDCGEAAVRTVLRYYRLSTGHVSFATPIDGADPRVVEGALRAAGLAVQSGEMSLEDLKYHLRAGRPVICAVTSDGAGHWVVASAVTRSRVHYHDPEKGATSLPVADWLAAWTDWHGLGVRFERWAIAASRA